LVKYFYHEITKKVWKTLKAIFSRTTYAVNFSKLLKETVRQVFSTIGTKYNICIIVRKYKCNLFRCLYYLRENIINKISYDKFKYRYKS
jgi:hypothetical protein